VRASWSDREIAGLGEGRAIVVEAALGPEARAVSRALEACDGDLSAVGVGRQRIRSGARGDKITWIDADDPPPVLAPLLAWFASVRDLANREAWLGLGKVEIQLAAYPPGAAYERHRDALRGRPGRRLTAIWYANPDWTEADGGELVAQEPEGPRLIAPILDRAVVFLSDRLEHVVRPSRRIRRAATAWFWGRDDPG
jgi:SM-20-related protein